MTPKLRIENLRLVYKKRDGTDLLAIDDVSLDVGHGEFLAIVGPSGCGKSTLLRLINGLMQPTAGRLWLDGNPLRGVSREVATVFQSDSLYPWRTVMANVIFGLELRGVPRKEAEKVAEGLLHLVGLAGFEQNYPHELSGGMRQRVNLARALAVDPEILLMDEPFAALDAQTREIMQAELLRIWSERRKTVIFITHQIDEAVYLADRVVLLTARPGRIRDDVTINLPRPRELGVKRTQEFHDLTDRLWEQLQEEVLSAMASAGERVGAPTGSR